MSPFKSSENVQKEEGGSDRSFSVNQSSSVFTFILGPTDGCYPGCYRLIILNYHFHIPPDVGSSPGGDRHICACHVEVKLPPDK